MKKYELTDETIKINGQILRRIRALRDFADVKAGDIGGYIENKNNLSHEGNAWVSDKAYVSGKAYVSDNARVSGNACISDNARIFGNAWVSGNACVSGNVWVCENAQVRDSACVCENAQISGDAYIFGNAWICQNAYVNDNARVFGNTWVCGDACVNGKAWVFGNARVIDKACVSGNVHVSGDAYVCENAKIDTNEDYTIIQGFGTECRSTTFYRCVDGKVRVKCGCFSGTTDEFRDRVKRTRNGKIAKEYLMVADLMEYHFGGENLIWRNTIIF